MLVFLSLVLNVSEQPCNVFGVLCHLGLRLQQGVHLLLVVHESGNLLALHPADTLAEFPETGLRHAHGFSLVPFHSSVIVLRLRTTHLLLGLAGLSRPLLGHRWLLVKIVVDALDEHRKVAVLIPLLDQRSTVRVGVWGHIRMADTTLYDHVGPLEGEIVRQRQFEVKWRL